MDARNFQQLVLSFYRKHGRHDLPWRKTLDSWAILVSEVMLQQTQVSRGVERFPRFMKRFPTVEKFARASQRSVLKEWLGLGYNRRALNLHRAAKIIVSKYHGILPSDPDELMKLPGIGPYTANAVLAFAFNKSVVVLDTNIRRVFLYHFCSSRNTPRPIGHPSQEGNVKVPSNEGGSTLRGRVDEGGVGISDAKLIPLIQKTLYHKSPHLWYSALMDYGALGSFGVNPNRKSRHYVKQSRFEGSKRFVRAKIVSLLVKNHRGNSTKDIQTHLRAVVGISQYNVRELLDELEREGFVELKNGLWRLKE